MSEDKQKFSPPPAPPQPPNAADYIRHFDRPLTKEEKIAWLGEVSYLVLNGIIPQSIYPELRAKIESLPEIDPSAKRKEEKLPGSDYVHPGPPKPLKATTSYFDDAESMTVFEKIIKEKRQKKITSTIITGSCIALILVFVLYIIYLGLKPGGKLTGESTPDNIPAYSVTEVKNNIPATDNPFADNKNSLLDNPFVGTSVFLDQEVVRVTLEFDELSNGKIRLEKTNQPASEFIGSPVEVRSFPNIDFRTKDGVNNMVIDFNRLDSSYANRGKPWLCWENRSYHDMEKRRCIFAPTEGNGLNQIFFPGHSLRGMPFMITVDFTEFKGEIFSAKLNSLDGKKTMFTCRLASRSGKDGPFSLTCRWNIGKEKDKKSYDLLSENNFSLNEKKEWTFPFPEPENRIKQKMDFFIGKNILTESDFVPDYSPVEISRIEVACRHFIPPHGIFLYDQSVTKPVVHHVGEFSLADKAGLRKWDSLNSINGKEYDKKAGWELLDNYELGAPLRFVVGRKNEGSKEIVIFE